MTEQLFYVQCRISIRHIDYDYHLCIHNFNKKYLREKVAYYKKTIYTEGTNKKYFPVFFISHIFL
jgi:hypothetical protein